MWERILNKKIYFISLALALFVTGFNLPAFAFPEYTSRQKALKLAGVLDHGYFKSIKFLLFLSKTGVKTTIICRQFLMTVPAESG